MASESRYGRGQRHALVIGVNGQDGSYLAEHLLALGWRVIGIGRRGTSRYVTSMEGYSYRPVDLSLDRDALRMVLTEEMPDRIYHFAAVHGASGFVYEDQWQAALQVNIGSVHSCLEHIRLRSPASRLLYASSVKAFDATPPTIVHEDLPRVSTCLYSITKNAATDLIAYYRRHHGVRATTLFFCNHESPRRPLHFFLPRATSMLAQVLRGERVGEPLRSVDFACDWGSSDEYMALGVRLLEAEENQDYVMATGRTWTGLEFVTRLFNLAGLDWRDHVEVLDPPGSRETAIYVANISRMVGVLGQGPRQSALDVARWILAETHGIVLDAANFPEAANS